MIVMPSGPGAPRFAFTCFQARSMLAGSTTASIKDIENKLKAGCSACAVTVRPGRDSRRHESTEDSSLFFIVRSFPSRLEFEGR